MLTTDELACYCDSKDELTNDVESTLSIVPDTVVSDQDAGHTNSYAFRISVRIFSFSVVILTVMSFPSLCHCRDELVFCLSCFVNNTLHCHMALNICASYSSGLLCCCFSKITAS